MGPYAPLGMSVPLPKPPSLGLVTLCLFHLQCLSMRRRLWGKVSGGPVWGSVGQGG